MLLIHPFIQSPESVQLLHLPLAVRRIAVERIEEPPPGMIIVPRAVFALKALQQALLLDGVPRGVLWW